MFKDNLFNRRTLFSTLTIFGLFAVVNAIPWNFEIFDPIQKALSDFKFSDVVFYEYRKDEPMDTNVVVINIGYNNRIQVAEQIRAINAFEPKVIGVDALFRKERTDELDTPLVNALREAKNVVMIARLRGRDDDDEFVFEELETTHGKFIGPNVSFGHNNFPKADEESESLDGTVRSIAPQLKLRDSLTIAAFAVKVVERAYPKAAERFIERGNDLETINYRGNANKFYLLDIDQMTPENLEIVRGKIVLLGFAGKTLGDSLNLEDKLYSPVSRNIGKSQPDMFGVIVHANIISMLLSGEYIDEMSDTTALILAILLCYINIAIFYTIEDKVPNFYGPTVKVIQFGQALLLMIASIQVLFYFNYNIQIGLMLAVALLSPDLYELYDGVQRFLRPKFRNAPRIIDEELGLYKLPPI
jgi:CHASE2 domain-containing sensor protein